MKLRRPFASPARVSPPLVPAVPIPGKWRPPAEVLEARIVPAAIFWDGGGNGTSWSDPLNWSSNNLPGALDDVTIDPAGDVTVTISTGAFSVKSLAMPGDDNLSLTGGSLTLTAASSIHDLTLSNARITAGGQVTLTGAGSWGNEGYLTGSLFRNEGTLGLTGGIMHLDSGVLHNAGTITQTSGRLDFNGDGSLLRNLLGGIYEVKTAGNNTFLGNFSNGETFLNEGTLRRDGLGNADMNGINFVNPGGTISALTGTLQLNVAGTMAGATFTVSAGAAVNLAGMTQTWTGTFSGSGAGDVLFNNANLTAGAAGATLNFPAGLFDWDSEGFLRGGTTTNTGHLTITGNLAHIDSATLVNTGTITQTGGRLDFNGDGSLLQNAVGGVYVVKTVGNNTFLGNFSNGETFLNQGTLRRDGTGNADMNGINLVNAPSGVFQTVTGTLQLNVAGTMNSATFNVAAGTAINLAGMNQAWTGTFSGTGPGDVLFNNASLTSGATSPVLNFPAGLFDWDSEGFFRNGTVTNTGHITITGNLVHLDSATLLNQGTITQIGGRLDFNGDGSVLNNLFGALYEVNTVGNNTFVGNFSNTETFLNSGTLRRNAAGNADMNGINLASTPTGVFEAVQGTLQLNVAGTLTDATFRASAGAAVSLAGMNQTWAGTFTGSGPGKVLFNNGNLTAAATGTTLNFPAGVFDWDSEGFFRGGVTTNTGAIQITGNLAHLDSATLINAGTITQTGGRLDFNGNNSLLHNTAGGLYEVKTAGNNTFLGNFSNSETFLNEGTLRRDGTGNADVNGVNLTSTPAGVFEAVQGTLQLNASGAMPGAIFKASAGAAVSLAGINQTWTGTFTGSGAGKVLFNNANLTAGTGGATLDFPAGLFDWDSEGFFRGGTTTNAGHITITSNLAHLENATLINRGTITQIGGRLDFNGSNSVLNNAEGGLYEVLTAGNNTFLGNFSNGEQFINAGTLRRDGTGSADVNGVSFTNTGVVEAVSGGLNINAALSNLVAGKLTGGTWIARSGATLNLPAAVTTNAASIVADGGTVTNLTTLAANTGALTLRAGSDLTTTASFSNSGLLHLGEGSVLTAPSFTQNAAGMLELEVGGTAVADHARLAIAGAANFGGTARVLIATDYTPAAGQSLTLATYGSTTGSFASFDGLNLTRTPIFERFVGANALTLNALVNAANLDVTGITAPASGFAGQDFAISYTVQNTSAFPTVATTWTDTVYLSLDDTLDGSDIVLARRTHAGALANGASYTESFTVPLTGTITGSYKVLVLADSRGFVADPDRENNLAATATASTLDIPALTDGVPVNGTIRAGQQLWYRLTLPAGETPNFTFTGAVAGEAEVYVAFGEVPTRADFLQKAFTLGTTTQQIVGEATAAGTYYVMLQGRESAGAGGQSFSLVGEGIGFEVTSSTLVGGPNVGKVTTTLTGSQFSPGTVFTLVPNAGTPRAAEATYFVNSGTVHATFDLTGLAAGAYDIVATKGAASDGLNDVFAVTNGGVAGTLNYSIGSPRYVRPQGGNVTITYENVGGTDLAAPLFTLLAENARLQLAGATGFIGAAYVLDGQPFSVTELLGVSGGLAGILSPGERGTIELAFQAINSAVGQKAKFEVLSLGATSEAFNLSTLVEELKPAGMRDDAWNAVFANFQAGVGNTVASYQQMLVENANYLGQFETVSPDITRLLEFELDQAGEFGAIQDRFTLGSLGRGQVAPFSLQALTAANGTVTITDGESTRVFYAGNANTFSGSGVETGKLTRVGGVITLTEASGEKTVFRASDGRIDFIEDANGRRLTGAYNAGGQVTSITDSFTGDVTAFAYNAAGRIATITDAVERVTSYTYDVTGEHVATITTPQGTSTFTYVTAAGPAQHALASVTGPDGVTTSFAYDARGRLDTRTVGSGAGALVTEYGYDDAGTRTIIEPGGRETSVFRTVGGLVSRTIDPLGDITTIRYDALGQVLSVTDASGFTTRTAADSSGLLAGVQEADRSQVGIVLGGDKLRLQSVTDPGGDITRFAYDTRGNLLSATLPDGSATTYEYDAQGRVTATIDANSQRSTFTYDADGLVTQRTFPGGQIDFTYDAHRNLLTAADDEGTTTFTYDSGDRITSVAYPNGKSVAITYDAAGRRSTVADGTGYTVRYSYDTLSRLDQVRDTANALLVDYSYDAAGQLETETRGNGSSTTYTYDTAGRVATITHRDAASVVTGSFAYTFDAQDRVSTVTTADGVTTYSYDLTGQLTKVVLPGGRTITYSYDAEGNRTSVVDSATGSETYSTNNGDQYTAAGEETLTYDRDGRLTTRTQGGVTTTYSYDAFGQLTGITAPGSVVTFDYDAMGNRIGKTENGVRTDFAEDPFGLGTLFGEYQGATATHYASGLGVAARESAGSTAFYHFDAAGNTALVSGAAGAAVATYKYLPFGEIAAQTGGLAQPFTFNGQLGVQDDPGDLFHMRARAFDAELGRFTTRDPIGFTGGDTNIYRFAQNDPVNFNDPSGLLIPAVPASVAGQVVAGAPSTVSSFVNGLRVAGLYTASGTNAGLAGAGAGVVETGVATGLSTAGGLTAAGVLGLIGIGTVAGVGSAAVITTGAEALDSSFRNNRDAHAQRLGYPDPNEPHFTPEFVNEWGKNPYFTDLVKKGLADGQSDRDAILDAVRILKKLGLDKEKKPDDKTESEVVRPSDPNNVIGPAGPGADPVPAIIAPGQFRFDGFVNSEADFPYTIQFENQPSATAPAQVVTVTQTLDADLDLTTFRFTSFGFGDFRITVPADADGTSFETIYDGALATLGVLVQVEAELNTVNGLLQVTFTSLDPLTNEVPADPFAGFLPANLVAPQGDGFLTYSVAPKAGLADGQEFTAIASIVFDTEDAISTPTVTNKLDDSAPTSQITAFASPTSTRQNIAVRWTSADNVGGSGLSGTTIFVSDNDGPLDELTVDDAGNALRFTGLVGHTYKFFSQAVDAVGNKEAVAALPDATITVIAPPLITAEGNKITLTDTDGDIYTVQLKGPAGAVLKYLQIDEDPSASVRGPLDFLVVENSTTQHSLSVSVKRAKDGPDADRLPDGDGIVSIGDVVINGSLSAFTAKASDLNVNGLTATGTVKTIGIRDLARPDEFAADPAITLGGTNVDQTTITARNIADGFTFTTPGIIKGVTAATIGDGLITAAGLGKLTTTLGAFDADLNLSGAVGAITVKGGVNTGNWQGATFGAITVNGGAFDADVTTVGAISKLTVKGGGASGQLSASKIGPVVITGGDFSGVISSVTSAETLGKTPALASLAITGGNLTGEIAALAKVGNVAVKADRSGVGGGLSGELSASSFGKVSLTGGSFSGSVTSLTAAATLAKTAALAGLSISGGDFTGDVRVLGAIGAISVLANQAGTGGNLTDASITAARIAAITVAKTAANSVVLAGADLGADHAFGGAADTFGSGSIGAIKIGAPRGTGTVVTNTLIGAGFTPGSDGIPRGSAADSIFGASEADQLTNLIASLTINGQADAASYFAAGRFKANPKIAGAAVDPSADPLARFLTV